MERRSISALVSWRGNMGDERMCAHLRKKLIGSNASDPQ
jgi:hypothetical protein